MGRTGHGASFHLLFITVALGSMLLACHSDKPPETAKPAVTKPQPNVVTLKVSPADAKVLVNGVAVAQRKVRLLPSNTGHKIRVERKGYKPFETRLSAQTNVVLKVTLEREPEPEPVASVSPDEVAGTSGSATHTATRTGTTTRTGTANKAKVKGVLGLLKQQQGNKYGIASIFGRDSALGSDLEGALGGAYGVGGLGLVGTGGIRVFGGVPMVRGPMAQKTVKGETNKRLSAVRPCLRKALKGHPKLKGKVVVRFIIDGKGKVRLARAVTNTLKKVAVKKCLLAAVKKCKFPAPRNGVKVLVTWPLVVQAKAAIGLGTLGTIGKGGSKKTRQARVILGRATVKGPLKREIIRRILRRHIYEPRYCYQRALSIKPNLRGRLEVQFTISATGRVSKVVISSSTMNNKMVEGCLAKLVRRWLFPKPRGGRPVKVTVPFLFRSVK